MASCVFVYGTLRRACGQEMHRMLEHAARFVGDATVRGTLYDLGAYPGLLVAGEHAGLVTGEVYALDPAREDATLAVLDEYEGCAPRDAPPHEYRRERVQVTLVDGSTIGAWTYVLDRDPSGLARIEGGDYVAWRQSGA